MLLSLLILVVHSFTTAEKKKGFGYKAVGVVNTVAHIISAVVVISHFNGLIA